MRNSASEHLKEKHNIQWTPCSIEEVLPLLRARGYPQYFLTRRLQLKKTTKKCLIDEPKNKM